MVDAKFIARARHFVPLSLLRHLAYLAPTELPEALRYVGEDGINAIKGIVLQLLLHCTASRFLNPAS